MTQARVRERLAILELPEELWPRVGRGEIPVGAVGALVALAKIHPGLLEVAVRLVLELPDVYDADRWTWSDVTSDALGMVASGLHDETVPAPAGVFVCTGRYALSAFRLDDKRGGDAAKLADLQGGSVEDLAIAFGREGIEQARKLGAAYTPYEGWITLIVGQDVADQIAGDELAAALKAARAEAKRRREATATSAAATPHDQSDDAPAGEEAQRARGELRRRPSVSGARRSTSSWAWRSSTR